MKYEIVERYENFSGHIEIIQQTDKNDEYDY